MTQGILTQKDKQHTEDDVSWLKAVTLFPELLCCQLNSISVSSSSLRINLLVFFSHKEITWFSHLFFNCYFHRVFSDSCRIAFYCLTLYLSNSMRLEIHWDSKFKFTNLSKLIRTFKSKKSIVSIDQMVLFVRNDVMIDSINFVFLDFVIEVAKEWTKHCFCVLTCL